MNLEDEHSALEAENTSSTKSVSPLKPASFFQERPPQVMQVAPQLFASSDSARCSTLRNWRNRRGRRRWLSVASDYTQTPGHHPGKQELAEKGTASG